jgi:long-chain acyl-CoA synthetase
MSRPFWELSASEATTAGCRVLDETGKEHTLSSLQALVQTAAQGLAQLAPRSLGFISMGNDLSSLVAYLACLQARHVALLLPPDLSPSAFEALVEQYRPTWRCRADATAQPGQVSWQALANATQPPTLHENLALLLSTSGSTGSAKLVRLSHRALQANAESIAQYLELDRAARAITVLPPSYSYGLSVINSHLQAGACLVLREMSVLSKDFVKVLDEQAITSISGVPYIYQMLRRTDFMRHPLPALRTLTQAGGRLDPRLIEEFARWAGQTQRRFVVMYGQTEATARISYVPPQTLARKIGSIGIAIPGGSLALDPQSQELIYRGPNAMMGYAHTHDDLARGDDLGGELRTGDLARVDADGYYYVTGRLKRFVKLAGNRMGLDELEQAAEALLHVPVSVGGRDDLLVVWIESTEPAAVETAKQWLRSQFTLHPSMMRLRLVERLPLLPTGKRDYLTLLEGTP